MFNDLLSFDTKLLIYYFVFIYDSFLDYWYSLSYYYVG